MNGGGGVKREHKRPDDKFDVFVGGQGCLACRIRLGLRSRLRGRRLKTIKLSGGISCVILVLSPATMTAAWAAERDEQLPVLRSCSVLHQ